MARVCHICRRSVPGGEVLCPACKAPVKAGIEQDRRIMRRVLVYVVLAAGLVLYLMRPGGMLDVKIEPPNDYHRPQLPGSASSPSASPVDRFRAALVSAGSLGLFVTGAPSSPHEGFIQVTVTDAWHYQPKDVRLQMAQALWKTWAACYSPSDPDLARLRLVDGSGNEVGGSRALAGSLIWVAD